MNYYYYYYYYYHRRRRCQWQYYFLQAQYLMLKFLLCLRAPQIHVQEDDIVVSFTLRPLNNREFLYTHYQYRSKGQTWSVLARRQLLLHQGGKFGL
jgi:hypothetical protein